ncbi:MAG: CopD family protein [Dehalococcoidia bacterium]
MDTTFHIIFIWVHILGIALFVGPQFFLAFAWVPAARGIADQRVRAELTRKLTRRFGWLGGVGLAMIVVAGSYLISDWRDYYAQPDDLGFTDLRYGVLFIVKMCLFIAMLGIVGLHTFVVGPRLADAIDAEVAGTAPASETRKARVNSMVFSISGLVLALAIMVLGVMMNSTRFSFVAT